MPLATADDNCPENGVPYREHQQQRLAAEIRPAVSVMLYLLTAYVAVDVFVSSRSFAVALPFYLGQFGALLVPRLLPARVLARHPTAIALGVDFTFTAMQVGHLTTASASVAGPAVTICMKLLGTALFLPWRPADQATSSLFTVVLYQAALWTGPRGAIGSADILPVVVFPVLTGVAAIAGTVFADRQRRLFFSDHRRLEDSQAKLEQLLLAQQRDAQVKAALARVGRELLSSVERESVLDSVCEVTTQVIPSTFSLLWLWDEDEQCFRARGHAPSDDPQWDEIRAIRISRSDAAGMLTALERGVASFDREEDYTDTFGAMLHRKRGLARGLFIPIERDGRIVGALTAGQRTVSRPVSEEDLAIANGVGQLASFALENHRLLTAMRRANELKGELLATMSHELRSPLNAIVGYADLLKLGEFGALAEEQQHAVERITANAEQLLDLIVATLDVSRLEAGRLQLQSERVCMAELVEEIRHSVVHLRDPGVAFECDVPESLPMPFVDPGAARAILQNFISNALKYTPAGSVRVEGVLAGDAVEVRVRDTGPGIPEGEHHKVFEPYWQAHGSAGLRGGHGLGLYIVKQLAEAIGAGVGFDSRPGAGSDFWVRFPLEADRDRPADSA